MCAGKSNKHGEGSQCKEYSGYQVDWLNGQWCYADVEACSDAKDHPSKSVPGYGASRVACTMGNYIYTYLENIYYNITLHVFKIFVYQFYHFSAYCDHCQGGPCTPSLNEPGYCTDNFDPNTQIESCSEAQSDYAKCPVRTKGDFSLTTKAKLTILSPCKRVSARKF